MIKADGMDMCEAIVIGSKSVNAVGLIRSLGAGYVNVTFMSTYSKIESKYTKEYVRLPDDRKKWLTILEQYGEKNKERLFFQQMMIRHFGLMRIIKLYRNILLFLMQRERCERWQISQL